MNTYKFVNKNAYTITYTHAHNTLFPFLPPSLLRSLQQIHTHTHLEKLVTKVVNIHMRRAAGGRGLKHAAIKSSHLVRCPIDHLLRVHRHFTLCVRVCISQASVCVCVGGVSALWND